MPGQQRQRQPAALPQLAEVELAPRLEPDDEEEERHQAAVDPVAEIVRDSAAAQVDRQVRRPDGLVRVEVDVRPQERGDRRADQDHGAGGLRAQERAQRRLEVPRPRGAAAEAGPCRRRSCSSSRAHLTRARRFSNPLFAPLFGQIPVGGKSKD